MEMETCVPPGFRFHPTEEELVGYYLSKKVNSQSIDLDVIVDVDLYKIEPWDLQQRCKLGYEDQNEWYFFSHKDKKYPTGTRTNRATAAGFWKATGRDKVVMSKEKMIGMRKTLVFYKGRAPNGIKTDWIMHEYRIQTSELAPPQEEGWVVCRAFIKQTPNQIKSIQESTWDNIYTNLSNTHAITDHERKVFSSNDLLFPQQNQYYEQSMGSTSDQMLMYESKLQARSNNFHTMAPANLSSSDTYETSDFSTVDHVEEHKNGIKELDHGNDDDRSNFGGWQSLDNFVAWQQSEATNSNQLPMMPSDYEAVGGHYLNDYQSIFHAT